HALDELLELDPGEHPWVTRRWVVLGDPGAGKTTLLRYLAWSLARAAQPRWVPLYESWPRLMRDREWLLDRIARQLGRAGHPARGLPAVLDREAQEGRLLLLLDGLDEIPREDRDEAERLLRDFAARWPRSPIVVTSRPIGYRRPAHDFLELDLLPLDRERQRKFLARWFGRRADEPDSGEGDRALRLLDAEAGLRELASNPLYLTLMALLIERGSSPDRHRSGLYDQVFQLLLDGGHRQPPTPMDCQDATRRVLRHLAHEMTRDNRDAEPREALEARLYQPEVDRLREPLERIPRWRRSLRPFLDDLAERTGILGPHDGPQADWRFWHRTFREALAAEALEQRFRDAGEAAVLEHAR
ncbi:MAG: NACHT domain-containing protein, partial [bacterium]|nr:NACHT domain-containing protein [bacterium]